MDQEENAPKCATCTKVLDPDQAEAPTATGRMLCDDCWFREEIQGKRPRKTLVLS